jgi:CheY-like chemotaxis protein
LESLPLRRWKEDRGLEKHKVMIVDDDEAFLEETADMLREAGYEVMTADSPDSALACLSRERPDIILMDFVMRGNGSGLVSRLRSDSATSGIPIVMISATPLEKITRDLDEMSEKAIVHGFMEKPLEPLDVISVIEMNLKGE